MAFLRNLKTGLRSLFRKNRTNGELDEELQNFLAHAVAENIRQGMNGEQAERAARAAIGSMAAVRDQVHAAGWEWTIDTLMQDVRYGLRTLRNQPGFTTVAVLTLALGIGVNTGIYTILNAAALKPLPYPRAAELIGVYQTFTGKFRRGIHGAGGYSSYSEYQQYRDNSRLLSGVMAYAYAPAALGGEKPRELMGTLATCDYFDVLEVRMALGRSFSASDCASAGASPVVILSDDLWRSDFAADPGIVGRAIHLNRELFTVAGIAPAGFQGAEAVLSGWWAPVTMQKTLIRDADLLNDPNTGWLVMRARMKPGVTMSRVRTELGVIASRIDHQYPGRTTHLQVRQASMFDLPEMRMMIFGVGAVVLCAVGLVLLVACANVANLLLARAAGRRKEMAVRLAIGATRTRIIRQLLTENLLLSCMGGVLGAPASFWTTSVLVRYILTHLPPGSWTFGVDTSPDWHVMAGAAALSLVTGLVFGLAPALQSARPDLTSAMKEEGGDPPTPGRRASFLGNALISSQVAISMVLLLAAGLLTRGLLQARAGATGFEMHNIVTASFDLTSAGYDEKRAEIFHRRLRERVAALPGVDGVGAVAIIPLSIEQTSRPLEVKESRVQVDMEENRVTPDFFTLVRIPIVRGRTFSEVESAGGAPVAIVTEATARGLWTNQDPIGKVLTEGKAELEVIGVAGDAQVSHLGDVTRPYMYLPIGSDHLQLGLMAHTAGDAGSLVREIQAAAMAMDSELTVRAGKLEDNLELWRAPARLVSTLSGFLGILALMLASIGVYGMVSFGVSRRIREIGIRMALGAGGGSVMRMMVRGAMRPVAIGALAGIAGGAAVSSLLAGMLYGVSPFDPLAFLAVPGLLMAVALIACCLPARRAMRVNPMEALRRN